MVSPSSACSVDSDCPPCQTCAHNQIWSTSWNISSSECIEMYPVYQQYGAGPFAYFCAIGNRCVPGPNYAQCEQKIAQAKLNAAQSAYTNAFNAVSNDATNNSNGLCTYQWQASTAPGSPCETLLSALNQYSTLSNQNPSAIICASIGSEDPNCASSTPSDSTFCNGFCGNAPPPPAASSEAMFAVGASERMMVRKFAVFSRHRAAIKGWVKPEDRVYYSTRIYVHRENQSRRNNQFYVHRDESRRENKPSCTSEKSKSPACIIYKKDHK